MPDQLTNIVGGMQKYGPLALSPIALIQNMLAGSKQNDLWNLYLQQEKRTAAALQPNAVAAGVAGLQQPLTRDLQQSVGNSVQADLAQRGLAQSPGIYTSAMAQALAPYAVKNREDALAAYMQAAMGQRFQLPWGYGGPKAVPMTDLLKQIMASFPAKKPDDGGLAANASAPNYDPTASASDPYSAAGLDSYSAVS